MKYTLFSAAFLLFAACSGTDGTVTTCENNQVYFEGECRADSDGDRIPDVRDNCPMVANYVQTDSDGNGVGDACEGLDSDSDGDGVLDSVDNCVNIPNHDQADSDNDGIGDLCDELIPVDVDGDGTDDDDDNCPAVANPGQDDSDNDGVGDACDNCPLVSNADQADSNANGIGDACEEVEHDGTIQDPFIIPVNPDGNTYSDSRNTSDSISDEIDDYPPSTVDESGPEYIYMFTLPRKMTVRASIASPEPDGVDIDIHLLSSVNPVNLIERANLAVTETLEPGTYYLSLDTYVSSGSPMAGNYNLTVSFEPWFQGTVNDPVVLGGNPVALPFVFVDTRNTAQSSSDSIDSYPPNTLDESGPEYVYTFTVDRPVYFAAEILLPEPAGADIDVHLLSSISPVTLVERANHKIVMELTAGTYYVVLDSYQGMVGEYTLNITLRERDFPGNTLFGDYMVSATTWIYNNYGLLGYDIGSVLTHDIEYGPYGTIPQTGTPNKTMCVAAVLEIILTAMQLYVDDTQDTSVWDFLPKRAWQYLSAKDIKAHIWVNYDDIDSGGSADALRHFGMGMNVPFERLVPGSVVNINRTTGTGHAVVFLGFLDSAGNVHETHTGDIIGFKYFSSQGSSTPGSGGMSYRHAIFSDYGCPSDITIKDCNVIYSTSQHYLNTGVIYHPSHWRAAYYTYLARAKGGFWPDVSSFDADYFDGRTTDD
ncbi:thrombospondin type 3 repeat-containing protein [Myxococcota bacterium]|nr:thrombospondin type 3 repeat-containing protein [Myxococcota bacterium]MBU1382793.1 thrombospondin type 3 repeat-containing protein [Myxococcota bacterium]MBU1495939.1 thrombospondin type 3 repeat-containing protein [Myxococcota bacterium]